MSNTPQRGAPAKLDPAVVRVTVAVLVGGLAVVFDTTIVAVALHTLATELHTSVATIQWVSTGYLLALGVTIPIAGWAQRRVGIKRLWLVALAIFGIGSVLCTFAWNAPSLIGFRVLQGVGGGIMLPLMTTLVMQAAGGAGLGKIMSVVSLPAVLGPVLGPVAGGLILDHLHWSFLFWVNVPFCAIGLVLAFFLLPKDGPVSRSRPDVVGVILVSPGLVGVLYGLSRTSLAGGFGRTDVLVGLIGGLLLIAAFVVWALRRQAAALVNVRLLDHWPLASSSLLLFLSGIALYGAMLLLPLYYQQLRGMSALAAGLMLIPQGLGTFVSRSIAGRLSDTMGSRLLVLVGFAITALGTLPFAVAGAQTGEPLLLATLFVRGLGLGAVTIPLMALAFRGLERTDIPDASIISRIASQVGGAFGTGVLAVILQHGLVGIPTVAGAATAFQISFWWSIGFAALAAVLSLMLPSKPSVPAAVPASPAPART